jgi:hypothetical protein
MREDVVSDDPSPEVNNTVLRFTLLAGESGFVRIVLAVVVSNQNILPTKIGGAFSHKTMPLIVLPGMLRELIVSRKGLSAVSTSMCRPKMFT